MARYANLAGVDTTYTDFGLQVANVIDVGDSLLVIGTASDGPLNQPVAIDSLDDALNKFGPIANGTLVRGIFEAMNATNSSKDIRGMRIGNATKATLSLGEASGVLANWYDQPTLEYDSDGLLKNIEDAFTLTAKEEGETANGISIWKDVVNGQEVIAVYNPYTNITSAFEYSSDTDRDVSVHNTKELVDAINSDDNLNPYMTASMKDLTAQYEVNLNAWHPPYYASGQDVYASGVYITGASGVCAPGDIVEIELQKRIDPHIVGTDSAGLPSGVHDVTIASSINSNIPTAGNKLVELQSCYLLAKAPGVSGVYGYEKLDCKGQSSTELAHVPIGRNDDGYWDGSNKSIISIDGTDFTNPQCQQSVVNGYLGTSLDGTTTSFQRDQWVNIQSDTLHVYQTVNGIKSEVAPSGVSTSFTGAGSTGKLNVELTTPPPINSVLTIDYRSNTIGLNEVDSKTDAQNTNNWTTIFVTGKTLYFGGAAPEDILLTYRYKKEFSIGGDVIISDADTGKIRFTNCSNSPKLDILASPESTDPTTGQGADYQGAILGLRYTYQPEMIDITSTVKTLSGGGDGITMSTAELKNSLASALEKLENYVVDIVVFKDIYLDETITDYNTETGVQETVTAGFAPMICEFLDDHAENTGEIIGIISVKPADSNSLADVTTWYRKLVEIDNTDPTRAANIMAGLNCKWLQVCAAEPLFVNAYVNRPYVGTMEALYGGLIQGLSPVGTISSSSVSQFTTTNKPVAGVFGHRYVLSNKQLDTLTASRYITLRNRPGRGLVITDGVTTASPGSDYRRLSTVRIVKNAMKVVRDVCEPFLGQPNTAEQRDAIDTAVTKGLQAMVEAGALRDFTFQVQSTVAEQVNQIVRVEMVLVPTFEMKRIAVTVKLRSTL